MLLLHRFLEEVRYLYSPPRWTRDAFGGIVGHGLCATVEFRDMRARLFFVVGLQVLACSSKEPRDSVVLQPAAPSATSPSEAAQLPAPTLEDIELRVLGMT